MSVSFWMNPMAHFSSLMIPQNADLSYCQLSLFIGDISHNVAYLFQDQVFRFMQAPVAG